MRIKFDEVVAGSPARKIRELLRQSIDSLSARHATKLLEIKTAQEGLSVRRNTSATRFRFLNYDEPSKLRRRKIARKPRFSSQRSLIPARHSQASPTNAMQTAGCRRGAIECPPFRRNAQPSTTTATEIRLRKPGSKIVAM